MLKIDCVIEDTKDEWLTVRYRRSADVEAGLAHMKGKQLTATFYEIQDIRSIPMNDLMHWYYRLIAKHQHEDFYVIKARCKASYGPLTTEDGELVPKPSHLYTIKEGIAYIEHLDTHCRVDLEIDVNPDTEMFEAHQEYLRRRRKETK